MREGDGDDDRIVEADFQTSLDGMLGTSASLAPGPLSTRYDVVDAHFEVARPGWKAPLWGWSNRRGAGSGVAQALDLTGRTRTDLLLFDLIHERTVGRGKWELSQRLSHQSLEQDFALQVFPPGAELPIGADGNVDLVNPVNIVAFPDGMIGKPRDRQNTTMFDTVAVYAALEGHRFRLNGGFERQDAEFAEAKNFGPGVIDGSQLVVDGTLTHVTGTPFVFMPDVDRDHWYLSAQDEWAFAESREFTVGGRLDSYSDFGSTLNPRLTLVWMPRSYLTGKLLYGSAFRAPSFGQLFAQNNPVGLGNPDLDPETIHTIELAVDARPARGLRTAFSVFRYEIEDRIDLVPDPRTTTFTAQNTGEQDGHGFEFELSFASDERFELQTSYAWQDSEDSLTGERVAEAPESQFLMTAHWHFAPEWRLTGQLNHLGERARAQGDPRSSLDGYTLVDLTLRRKRVARHLDVALIGRNIFDEEGREPSDPVVPGDFRVPGPAIYAELTIRLP